MDVFSTVTVIIRGGVNQPVGWAPGQPVDDRSLGAATVTTEWTGDNSSTSGGGGRDDNVGHTSDTTQVDAQNESVPV